MKWFHKKSFFSRMTASLNSILLFSCWLQVSLNDGWVDQEAAVCQGVDDAVRGAKVG